MRGRSYKIGHSSVWNLHFAKKPYVVAYKVNPLSAYMLRKMIRTKYFSLVNILLHEEVIAELMQEDCEADYIKDNLEEAILNPQIDKCQQAIESLKPEEDILPSAIAASEVLSVVWE